MRTQTPTKTYMQELRRWKIETANLALTPDEELSELPPLKVGETIGIGGGDILDLDTMEADDDSSRSGDDDDAHDGSNSTSDTDSQAPTARALARPLSSAAANHNILLSNATCAASDSIGQGGRMASAYKKPTIQVRMPSSPVRGLSPSPTPSRTPTSAVTPTILHRSISGGVSNTSSPVAAIRVAPEINAGTPAGGEGAFSGGLPVPPPQKPRAGPAPRRISYRTSVPVSETWLKISLS